MPDFLSTPFDRARKNRKPISGYEPQSLTVDVVLPASGWAAILRGLRGKCPRCGEARLFKQFLKPIGRCPNCSQDLTHQQADDFPAYLSILVTGHLLAPLIIALTRDAGLSIAALMAIIIPLAVLLLIALLQPAKGAVIALQWWFGMHGFRVERARSNNP
ncbi:MAG: DUF983 domain-containing protein [Sphingomonadales bacterium]|nr:DUF983 domain-containing protein [Sphingomonadales bacterium]NCP28313.1 DUF983 domain-containing protein [Sphingomonadales bacterium]NCQ22480.1 DUF983 domain-containing protein [Sphingomonadales bacterium]NCQ63467.1 DUF983 domain-containing protein [Alphaproteobacteria bacterium]